MSIVLFMDTNNIGTFLFDISKLFYFSACLFKEITPTSKESDFYEDNMNPQRN